MRKRFGLVLLVFATALFAISAEHGTWMNHAVEYRPFTSLDDGESFYVGFDDLILKVNQELKFSSGLTDSETLMQIGYEFSPYFSMFVGHRIVSSRSSGDERFLTEQRPTLDVALAAPEFMTLKLDLRSRFELRDRKGSQPYMRYRQRLRLRTSWSCTSFKFSPFISDEVFFSDKPSQSSEHLFDRNRAMVGVSFKPIPQLSNFSCSIYYMVQHDISQKGSHWEPLNIFGFDTTVKF